MFTGSIFRIIDFLWEWWIRRVICQHFCKFKEAGSNFKHCHVHILGKGRFPGNNNPRNYTGVGHDDETPGMSNPGDEKHSTVSTIRSIDFHRKPDGTTTYPSDLQARMYGTAYFHPAPKECDCPEGFFLVKCDCGDACVTFNREAFETWHKKQKD